MRQRAGLTLIEMLVAVAVFMVGFVSVYALFLHGLRDRALADSTVHGSLAASSLIATMRLHARSETGTSVILPPGDYVGDGDPNGGGEGSNGALADDDTFYAHPDHPGTYYRVYAVTDITGGTPAGDEEAFRAVILTGNIGDAGTEVEFSAIKRRFGLAAVSDNATALRRLLEGASFQRSHTVIERRVTW